MGSSQVRRPAELLSADAIADRVRSLAGEIAVEHAKEAGEGANLHLLVVLRGAFLFAADLARELAGLGVEATVDFCRIVSYRDGTEPGVPEVHLFHPESLEGRHVLVVEDIVDTGVALEALRRALRPHRFRSLRSAALLSKPARRRLPVEADYTGFVIPDRFVVGYGLDYAGRYRHLPYVGVLEDGA